MQSNSKTPKEYVATLPEDRKIAIEKLRKTIVSNLPEGFHEEMSYIIGKITRANKRILVSATSGVEPEVTFVIEVRRCCLSPGLMRSGL